MMPRASARLSASRTDALLVAISTFSIVSGIGVLRPLALLALDVGELLTLQVGLPLAHREALERQHLRVHLRERRVPVSVVALLLHLHGPAVLVEQRTHQVLVTHAHERRHQLARE